MGGRAEKIRVRTNEVWSVRAAVAVRRITGLRQSMS